MSESLKPVIDQVIELALEGLSYYRQVIGDPDAYPGADENIQLIESRLRELDSDFAFASLVNREFSTYSESQRELIECAREQPYVCDGQVEIDDAAIINSCDGGAYVSGWVWVYDEDTGNDDETENEDDNDD